MSKIWFCKIGEVESVPYGADSPMRQAVAEAYERLTGHSPVFIFSGWGGELVEGERAVVENRLPAAAPPVAVQREEHEEDTRVAPTGNCVAPKGSTAESSPGAVTAAERTERLACWWCGQSAPPPLVCNDAQTIAMCGACAQKVADFLKPCPCVHVLGHALYCSCKCHKEPAPALPQTEHEAQSPSAPERNEEQ